MIFIISEEFARTILCMATSDYSAILSFSCLLIKLSSFVPLIDGVLLPFGVFYELFFFLPEPLLSFLPTLA